MATSLAVVPEILAAGRWVGRGQRADGFVLPPSYKDFIVQLVQGTLRS